jgi:hypothetical protein
MASRLIPLLIQDTGLAEHDIYRIVSNAPVRYKIFQIPKRNGGARVISQPARELKALQRVIVDRVLSACPVHSAAMAYRPGTSIKLNAAAHVNNGSILKFDFKDFFPSITSGDWQAYCKRFSVFDDDEDISISTNILFQRYGRQLRLAIGAPSSPCLSNVLMYDFDTRITQLVSSDRVAYTRYADDLTFSAPRTGFLTVVKPCLQQVIREIKSPSLAINEEKTVLATKKYKRMVTGLILTNDNKVSIGHRRKREIRAALHEFSYGRLNSSQQARLAGNLAFINDVEPNFLVRLKMKFGDELIHRLKRLKFSQGGDEFDI